MMKNYSCRSLSEVVGKHVIAELLGGNPTLLNDERYIKAAIKEAAERAGGTVLDVTSHKFTPQGVTALALLSESHISIHSWPEHGYAAVDVFTCGSHTNPQLACDFLKKALDCTEAKVRVLERGMAVQVNDNVKV
jgi:S-adenosylmethionine decarboxylase